MKSSKKSIISRSISGFLAFLMIFSLLASLSLIPTFATGEDDSSMLINDLYTNFYTDPNWKLTDTQKEQGWYDPDFTTPEKRIAVMELKSSNEYFELYVDEITGEVALKDKGTGDIMFSNPYDISEYALTGEGKISSTVKPELLSQVQISFNDNGNPVVYNSFEDAALLGQISIKRLRGGVRIEYSIGEEESRSLVPRQLSYERFESMIIKPLLANIPLDEEGNPATTQHPIYMKVESFYEHYQIKKSDSDIYKEEMLKTYPALKKYGEGTNGIAVFTGKSYNEVKSVERYIKTYCPQYTYEELDKDHMDVGYTSKDKAPANFRMALEYYLTDMGVEVRFPANGLSFDESAYELTSIDILPYMGAGNSDYKGYNFIPDGSGALMRFENATKYFNVTGKVYGDDYAYQEISSSNQETFRMPVFGVVTTAETMNSDGTLAPYYGGKQKEVKTHDSGFVAIVTEGDALTTLTSLHGGGYDQIHPFNSVYCSFTPRPKDTYNLSEAISVGGSGKVTVVSDRKYTGSFRINYIMLTDTEKQTDSTRSYYDTSYVGMAKAYRDFLEKKGTIKQLDASVNEKDIPLYIEAFGAVDSEETFLSIPITVTKPLTTFGDLEVMIAECKAAGINNIGLRLTGYTNGGLISTVPTKVDFESAVGGDDGFVDFLKKANELGVEVYPEFDFAYMSDTSLFDGFSYSSDAVKSIDGRYITKRAYSAVLQTFSTTGKICISSCVYDDYFADFDESFDDILDGMVTNISLGTLGSDLNSDFDDDDPYNREDAKNSTLDMLKRFDVDASYGKIMVDAGNAYAMQYADVVLNAPLDSSRYSYAAEAVPFFGMVYHGYVVFAGSPTNMTGDIKYETLKILENGATLYMMLSYQNVELLKKDENLSKYYAVSYEIWKNTLFNKYDENGNLTAYGLYGRVNNALKGVQSYRIDEHAFINCNRQMTEGEKSNIREDAIRELEDDKTLAYDVMNKALNRQDQYFNYIYVNKAALSHAIVDSVEYDIYNNVEDLRALVDETDQDSLTWEVFDKATSYYGVVNGETVYANQIVIKAIMSYYEQAGDSANYKLWEKKLAKYCNVAFTVHLSVGLEDSTYENVKLIVGDAKNATEDYAKFIAADGEDSVKLTEKIEQLTDDARENLIVNDGSVVFVKYENGQYFILNYNTFIVDITVEEIKKAVGYVPEGFPEGGLTLSPKDFYDSREGVIVNG